MSHTRSTFPYDDDRAVILGFLRGERHGQSGDSTLTVQAGTLQFDKQAVAWFNPTDNALMGKLLKGAAHHPGVLLLHAIADALGAPELRVARDVDKDWFGKSAGRPIHHFFAGSAVQIDQPFLIVGPMAITAYRAALKARPRNPQR